MESAFNNVFPVGTPDPARCMVRHVMRTSRAIAAAYDPALACFGVSGHQFNVLMTLHSKGACTVNCLARRLGMDASTVPRVIRPLAQKSWVNSEKGDDRRQRILSITDEGRQTLMRALPAWAETQNSLVRRIGASNWNQMMTSLSKLRAAAHDLRAGKDATP